MTIKEVLNTLPDKDRRLLMYAFEHELSQYVELEGNMYIGVNISGNKRLIPDSEAGVWSYGKVKNG